MEYKFLKKTFFPYQVAFLTIIILQLSCVSKKQYESALRRNDTLNNQLKNSYSQSEYLYKRFVDLQFSYNKLLKIDTLKNANNPANSTISTIAFPNPPPQASSTYNLNPRWFSKSKTYGDVNKIIVTALNRAGYDSKLSYFSFDNGFVIATQLEKINADGTIIKTDDRWLANVGSNSKEGFSFKNYFKALLSARPGYYRSFVFVVSSSIYKLSGDYFPKDLFSQYIKLGLIDLPPELANIKVRDNLRFIVLVYEYKKMESANDANLILDGHTALQHLKSASIIDKFGDGN